MDGLRLDDNVTVITKTADTEKRRTHQRIAPLILPSPPINQSKMNALLPRVGTSDLREMGRIEVDLSLSNTENLKR